MLVLATLVFFAFAVQATSGFGSVMLSLALGGLVWPISALVPIVVPLSFFLSLYIVWREWIHIDWRVLTRLILPLMGSGVVLGIVIVPYASQTLLRVLLGCIVCIAALRGLWAVVTGKSLAAKKGSAASLTWIFGAGVVHGMIATGGPALVYAVESMGLGKRSFRCTLAAVWLVLNAVLSLHFVHQGILGIEVAKEIALLLPVIAGAMATGQWLHSHVSEKHFRTAVFTLLLVAGVLLWLPVLLGI